LETALGVFGSRQSAEDAVRELLSRQLPPDAVVFLTRSAAEASSMRRVLSNYVSTVVAEAVDVSLGPGASTLLVPALGRVFSIGYGAAQLLGIANVLANRARSDELEPTPAEKASEDAALFREVLRQRHSIVLVRTESYELARTACEVLDRRALGLGKAAS
jgi:hypothetical protein